MEGVTELKISTKDPARLATDALVIGVACESGAPRIEGADALGKGARAGIERAITLLGVTGEVGEVTKVPAGGELKADLLVLTGTGAPVEDPETARERLRRAAGAALAALAGTAHVSLALPVADAESLRAVAEGALFGNYRFAEGKKAKEPVKAIELIAPGVRTKDAKGELARAEAIADAVHGARDLVNLAPNLLFPESFAARAVAAAKGTAVKVTVLDEAELRAGGFGGLIGVGQGSARGPRLVKLSYRPARARRHIALVGKGITFDSGGLSLKPAKGMETMKNDMAGAAAVLHAVLAAARLGLPVAVTGWLALAENMPSGSAQRPSDVITIRGGKTVEVLNTDAEGRLVMADALVAATEEGPDAVIDIATLTGAQMVALGNQVSAVMGSEDVRTDVVAAAGRAGEQFWPMPLPDELRASMNTPMADIANIGDRFGGMLVAGLFLREFVGETPWAHLDIAGPAFNDGAPRHYVPKGGTGVGVRTLVEMLSGSAQT
ncbi:leucyl aminopeptidase [Ruania halotolerans]|uniref:leucyl aminopeptidase n=1 Tax=Ruania halotolerans TaxID=2897773 RepID=UPI001E4867BF|nr:leucyl aminopeptidase [Ruania halotolerans]UFU04847.1 leucyl aminopeptidase [Ruania halotolerans]